MESNWWREVLRKHEWEEGKVISIVDGSYRTRCVITCTSAGRQETVFADGEKHAFGAYAELTRPDGTWIDQGNNIVPVLPDGRLIMIVEQRPAQYRLPNQPENIIVDGKTIPLREFGPYSSLEFPGGAVASGEEFKSSFLRELTEETEVAEQDAEFYLSRPFSPMGSDIALEMRCGVIYLKNFGFSNFVQNDGGLHVMALAPEEVQRNIFEGNIRSGQAALLGWGFYLEMTRAQMDPDLFSRMMLTGYVEKHTVHIKRA